MVKYVIGTMCGALLVGAVGCGDAKTPTVTFKSAGTEYIGAEGFSFNFVIDLHNPNNFAIPVREATYTLLIGDAPMLHGTAHPPGTIPAGGDLEIKLPMNLPWGSVLGAEEAIRRNRGDVPFTLEGNLTFDASKISATQPASVPLRYSGVVPVRQVLHDPGVILRSPAARRLAEMAVDQVFGQASQPATSSAPGE